VVLVLYVVLWTLVWYIMLGGLYWTHCELPILLKVLAKMLLIQCPLIFWSNFFESLFNRIFLFSNHMLSPTSNSSGFCLFLLNYFFIFFCASFIDFVACSQLLCNSVRNSSNFGNSICIMRLPFYGCLPKFSSNGVFPVATCLLSLYWNSAAANHSVQLSCW